MFYIVYGQFPGKSGFCKRNSYILFDFFRKFFTVTSQNSYSSFLCLAKTKNQFDRGTFSCSVFPINPSICPSGSSIDISNVKFPYVFRTFCIVIIQFPPFFFMFCCLTFYINLKQIPHQAFHDCVISISKVSYRFYFSSRISFTTSDISSFFIPMESARSITLSKSSSIAFCLASSASCLSEADT